MRIREIKIKNFKGFEDKVIEFKDNLTVVIGNNTAGKTTLLKALQVGLGAFLQCLENLPAWPQFRRNFGSLDEYKAFDPVLRDYIPNKEHPRISLSVDYFLTDRVYNGVPDLIPTPVSWYREYVGNHTTHSKACVGELMALVQKMEARRNDAHESSVYPLVLSFGAKRTEDAQVRTATKIKERSSRIEKAYKFALHDKVDFKSAMEWLQHYDKDIRDKKEFEGTRDAFFEALRTAIPALSEIDFDNGEIEAVVTVSGHKPTRHHFSYMSDGLQSMINIVSEIAHRCIELNGFLGKNSVKNTPGVVMIDEIDLYLHPHWQRHVLQDLTKAFPMIQFIVSTHSPFIVQSLKKDQLVSFDDGVSVSGEPFKESLEDIASLRMGLDQQLRSRRFNEMVTLAEEYYQLVKNGTTGIIGAEEIKKRLDEIESEFSDDPAYVALLKAEKGRI